MLKKILFFVFFFYLLVLIQTSFLVKFSIFGIVPNLVLISVILFNVFTDPKQNSGVLAAFIAGFFLDVFSRGPFGFFGFYTLISMLLALFLKFILKNYVQVSFFKKF